MADALTFGIPAILGAHFAWWVDNETERKGQTIEDTIVALYDGIGEKASKRILADEREKYAAGKRILENAQLIVGDLCRPYTLAAATQRALIKKRCPDSVIALVGGYRLGAVNVRHAGLKIRTEEGEANNGRKDI